MTTVESLFRLAAPPAEAQAGALAAMRQVYGIRTLSFDRAAGALRVEYDATRLCAPAILRLIHQAGLDVLNESAQLPPPPDSAVSLHG